MTATPIPRPRSRRSIGPRSTTRRTRSTTRSPTRPKTRPFLGRRRTSPATTATPTARSRSFPCRARSAARSAWRAASSVFEPTANYVGAASFTYTIRDSFGATDTATVSFNITNVNDAPVIDLDADNSSLIAGRRLSDDLHPGRRCRSHRRQRHPHHRRGW